MKSAVPFSNSTSPATLRVAVSLITSNPMTKQPTTLDDVLSAVKDGFDGVGDQVADVQRQLDRIESIIDKWPPPSYVTELLERVSVIEKRLGIRPP